MVLIVSFFLSAIFFWLGRPSVIGKRGERRVSRALSTLDPSRYKILNDILIRTPKRTSQIDHIVLSRKGIFVVETKCFSGWIHGNEAGRNWTQTIYSTRRRFLNPIHQNQSHVRALRELLNFSSQVPIYPIVVFAGSGELKNVNVTSPVVYANELTELIELTGTEVLSNDQVKDILGIIQRNTVQGKRARKLHISGVNKSITTVLEKVEQGVCPRCGGGLIPRKGRYGKFLGCSNYPRCRFTSKIRGIFGT